MAHRMKPVALYYRILKYQSENYNFINEHFELLELEHPGENSDALLVRVELLFAPLGFQIDDDCLARCPRLKVIVSNTTGVPHIDVAAAERRNVEICALHNEQGFLEAITPTAEHTIGLMLAAARRLPWAHQAASAGQWDRRPWGTPRMISRLRMGLVGYGRLGRMVGVIARAMGMDVAWFDPQVAIGEGRVNDLLTLAARSDVLSLHAVANEHTRGLVSRQVLEALPKGSIVINTARGELLDTDALLDLLECGHLWAAALDTIDGEYQPDFPANFGNSRVAKYARDHDNLIVTPHIGGSTVDAWYETEWRVIEKACGVLGINVTTGERQ